MRRTLFAVVALLLAGCSGSPPRPPVSTVTVPFASPAPTSPSADGVQQYLDQVNALCDALLPKVLAAIHGGHDGPYPVRTYFAEEPAHQQARDEFDAALAKVSVPAAATAQHAALASYLRFANRIDAARDAAAHEGQKTFDAEITHERTVDLNSPVITALETAGFNDSCTAR
jgi:hypothetical protein